MLKPIPASQGLELNDTEIGWHLHPDAWGHGYAKEAAVASLSVAFDRFPVDEVIALTVPRNVASWGLMLRLGMQRREDLDFSCPDFDPEDPTIIVYSLSRAQWQQQALG